MSTGLVSDPALIALTGMMQTMFPAPMGVAVTDPRIEQPAIYPAERQKTAGMIPARLREFSAGRHAARLAMKTIGQPAGPIPMGEDRAPIWPEKLRGSLSHCESACVAVVTSGPKTVGVDLEHDLALDDETISLIANKTEQNWLQHQPTVARGHLARLLFCAKEAVYKAQYRITGELFDFDTLNVSLFPSEDRFYADFTRDIGSFKAGDRVDGRLRVSSGFILAGVVLGSVD